MPELFNRPIYLTDGGIETDLIFNGGFDLPHFASIDLLRSAQGRAGIEAYFRPYLELAAQKGFAFVLESPSWRASPDWIEPLGYSEGQLAQLNREAIRLMHALAADYRDRIPEILVSGCIGPRGDGYDPGAPMHAEEAEEYHSWQIGIFAEEGVDLVTAITMTNLPEAIGVARAAAEAGVPSVISFTVETDGRLPTGMPLAEAIAGVDSAAGTPPRHFMINCAHPAHFERLVAEGGDYLARLGGLRSNASRKSHEELDLAETLDVGDPQELGALHADLARRLPGLKVVGGCCGTDVRHIACMAEALAPT